DVTVVFTGHNEVNEEPSDVYMTTVEHPNVEISENQSPEVKFSEIQFPEVQFPEVKLPEVKFPEIQFPSLEPIFEKIREFFESIVNFISEHYIMIIVVITIIVISIISPWILLGFLRLLGFATEGIVKGSLVALAQSARALPIIGFGVAGIIKGSLVAICQSIAAIEPVNLIIDQNGITGKV
ncbi:8032_t:CDS:2, partial [Racocetra fulgida]